MAYRSRKWTPRLECLDDRALPSVTVTEANGVLVVRGDQFANNIVIADDGTANAGAILVQYDGLEYWSQGPISTIRVFARGGADSVEYHLTWALTTSRKIVANLGNQDDSFTANLNYELIDSTKLAINVLGGNGQDNLWLNADGVAVPETSELCVRFHGGNGKDTLLTEYSGFLAGAATFISDGGNGKDSVSGNIALDSFELGELPGEFVYSPGSLTARMRGGHGADVMTLAVVGDDGLTESILVANGGHGRDTYTEATTSNVSIFDPDQRKKK